ncbi:MAG: S-layer homology domain-containing protein [Clostridiaceae bacterium]|nr:S-layer homology domain-containing protein [Clostridiaceae bacterium]
MKTPNRIISLILCIMLIFSIASSAYAANDKYWFTDVKESHWAYEQIMWMLQNKIIEGVGNNRFDPSGIVTRAQFAKMMVLTLKLPLSSPSSPSFQDVKKNDWEYQYVESAKRYLTGFKSAAGENYYPDQPAVREDMAVALVNALGYTYKSDDETILKKFADHGQISPNLRNHVALSVKHGLITGYTEKGSSLFKPQGQLTRAEAATLLYKAFKNNEEKITYDETKVTYDDEYKAPAITVSSESNKLVVKWNKINSDKLKAYAVVISKNDSTPAYPDNGYLIYITDKNKTSVNIDNSTPYNGSSDFGKYLKKGEKYYISVTAVYKDKNVPGNTERKTYNGPEDPTLYTAPEMSISFENNTHIVRWNKITSNELKAYAVTISKYDPNPKYPGKGHLYYITDKNKNYAFIDNSSKYNNGDFGKYLVKGQQYYISLSAVYKDKVVTSKGIQFTYEGKQSPEAYIAPKVTVSEENGRLVVRWDKIDSSNLQGYKVVASKDDSTPSYPENGYLYWITDKNKNYAVVDNSTPYNNGDFGKYFTKGQRYYFSVTAVYKDKNVAGNTVRVRYNGTDNPESYQAPVVTSEVENGKLIIRWNKIDSPNLQGYRVVASKKDSTPSYPENGHLLWITDKNRDYAVIDNSVPYNGGDFGKYFIAGESYYFSVTAVYKDRNIAGGTVFRKYEGPDDPELFKAPVVKAEYEDGSLVVKWNKIDSPELTEYRVVISQNNQSPAYPANGYYGVYGKDTVSVILDDDTEYTNGDFSRLTDGVEYYFSVTAVYNNNKYITGNIVKKLYLLPPRQ